MGGGVGIDPISFRDLVIGLSLPSHESACSSVCCVRFTASIGMCAIYLGHVPASTFRSERCEVDGKFRYDGLSSQVLILWFIVKMVEIMTHQIGVFVLDCLGSAVLKNDAFQPSWFTPIAQNTHLKNLTSFWVEMCSA